jgi:hypothetical protein
MIEQLVAVCGGCMALGAVIFVIAFIWGWLQPRIETVRDEERVVIYSRGRFKKMAGPGWVFRLGAFDTVERHLNVRFQPDHYSVPGLFVGGIPVGLTINMWCRFDPQSVTGSDQKKLAQMVRFTDAERRQQMEVLLRTSLVHRFAALEAERNLPPNASYFTKLQPVLPGLPLNDRILGELRDDIEQSWRTLGMFLDTSMPLVITDLQLPDEVRESFKRGRIVDFLRDQYPQLSDAMLAQITNSLLDKPLPAENLVVDGSLGGSTRVERITNLKSGPTKLKFDHSEPAPDPTASSAEEAAPESLPLPPRLSKSDLQVLKRVPPDHGSDRASA